MTQRQAWQESGVEGESLIDHAGTEPAPLPVSAPEPKFPLWLLALAAIGVGLFFVSVGEESYWPGWARQVWNFGHVPVFAALAWLGWRWLPARNAALRWALGMLIAALLGIGIELAQLAVGGREVSLDDVLFDLGGAWLGFWWVNHRRAWRRNFWLAMLLGSVSLVVLMALALPALRAGISAIAAHRCFPALLAADMPLLEQRMGSTGGSRLLRTAAGVEVELGEGPYAGFKLFDGPRDWRRYEELLIALDNRSGQSLALTCRVHDVPHDQMFTDRFNGSYTLPPGDHTLAIALTAIAAAPQGRRMALDDMLEVGCFVSGDVAGDRLVIREIRLR